MYTPWRQWIDAGRYAADVNWVIALRLLKLAAGGPHAAAEAQRMIAEKCAAAVVAQVAASFALASGKSFEAAGRLACAPVKSRVRANRRRLTRRRR